MALNFKLQVLGQKSWDEKNGNVDVEVRLSDGKRFVATFFTLSNILNLLEKYAQTGECAYGLYVWSVQMIVIRELTLEAMTCAVETLIRDGEFESAFRRIPDESVIIS